MNETIEKLNYLKKEGVITDFELVNISETDEKGKVSPFGNHERLVINFGKESLVIDCFCSGASENLTIGCS